MHQYLGDLLPSQTLALAFNSSDLDAAPITLDGTPVVQVYRDDSDTEDASGITLNVDYDSRTGLHRADIDFTADATFYAKGHDFFVVITTGTVDGVSVVGKCVAQFSIMNRALTLPLPDEIADVGVMPNLMELTLALYFTWCTQRVRTGVGGLRLEFTGVDHGAARLAFDVNTADPTLITRVEP